MGQGGRGDQEAERPAPQPLGRGLREGESEPPDQERLADRRHDKPRPNLRIKTTAEVLHSLIDIISKNGCLLLNISPKADGTIPQDQREVLLGIGEWLACCGEAVYETRPWVVFGEGPTRLKKGGHFVRSVRYTDKDVRFSTRGDTLYAIFLGIPKGKATIASLATNSGLCGGKVRKVTLLGSDRSLGFTRDAEGLHVEFPREVPCKHAVAIRIEGLKIEGFKPDLSARFKDGKLVLEAADAELHGPGIHTESKDAGRTNIGYWDDPSAYPAWEATFPTKGAYRVVARIAARAPSRFTVAVGRDTLACQVEATGDWDKFRDFTLGKIEVSEPGKKTIKVLPDKKAWKAINLSTLVGSNTMSSGGRFQPTLASLLDYECPRWFRDAKFGIYLHWGVYSVAERGEWYARNLYLEGHPDYLYHLEHYGHPSKFGYKDFIPLWKAERWDPDGLLDLFKRAGAKYFTPCAVHIRCDHPPRTQLQLVQHQQGRRPLRVAERSALRRQRPRIPRLLPRTPPRH